MRLLPESNGLYKVKKRRQLSNFEIAKRIISGILILVLVGFVIQLVINFIGNEMARPRLSYGRVDGAKYEFKTKGSGKYSIIFDGAIGTNLYAWDNVVKEIDKSFDANTFTYNRSGYGFSDKSKIKTPEQQAEDLRNVLKKAGVYPPYILVGEEYGSLVLSSFAKKYKDEVVGVILINPITEETLKSEEFKKSLRGSYIRSNIEHFGSYVSLTALMDKLNLTLKTKGFEDGLDKGPKEEFEVHENKKPYKQAVKNEISNLYKGDADGQVPKMFGDVPLYIIYNKEDASIEGLGGKLHKSECKENLLSIYDSDNIVNAIEKVLLDMKKIEAAKKS